jgi:predicted amidohydrolase
MSYCILHLHTQDSGFLLMCVIFGFCHAIAPILQLMCDELLQLFLEAHNPLEQKRNKEKISVSKINVLFLKKFIFRFFLGGFLEVWYTVDSDKFNSEGIYMIRVAAYQATPHSTDKARKEQIAAALEKADQQGIDFLCFPEGFLTGYYSEKEDAIQNSLNIQDALFQEWLSKIASFRVTAIVGFNEREGDRLYDAAVVVEQGELLGVQRKHYLYHDYFTPSSDFTTFQSKGVTFGVVICLDSNYFEPARILALKGAAILFTPMCNKASPEHPFATRPPYYSHFVARAHENRCWIVGADWIWENDGNLVCPGHSIIYDSDGVQIARSDEGKEQFIIAEVSLDTLLKEKGKRVFGSKQLIKKLEAFY